MIDQNPYTCTDSACVLMVPGAFRGMRTNGGCKCLSERADPETRHRVRKGIRWLAERLSDALEAAP